jgi:CRISPR-associated protein Csb1
MSTLTVDLIRDAVAGNAAAFRTRNRLQPAEGEGSKVFPPTYAEGTYALENRRVKQSDGSIATIPCVLIDSVQSQANRHEEALQNAIDAGRISLPLVVVDFPGEQLLDAVGTVTSLTAPHRIADAILRDSEINGVRFRQTDIGRSLDNASLQNATPLYELCPTALIFGMWDSTGPRGGLGAKFQRAFVSEIVGINAIVGRKTSSRIDPLQIRKEAGPVFRKPDGTMTTNANEAVRDQEDKCLLYGKSKKKDVYILADATDFPDAGKPSTANHGNVTPDYRDENKNEIPGGVTLDYAEQTAVLSLAALRRLHFPVNGDRSEERDIAGRTVLATIALAAAALAYETGFDLRSRCLLWPEHVSEWELLATPGEVPQKFRLVAAEALKGVKEAVAAAEALGLVWRGEPLVLTPSASLVALLRRSQEIAATTPEE